MKTELKIPPIDFISTDNEKIKIKIGKLKLVSNENFKYIHNVEIKISENIVISFKDPENLINIKWEDYDFTDNNIETKDYEFKYKNVTILFKNTYIIQYSGINRKAKARQVIIKKGKIDPNIKVNVYELIDENYLYSGAFEQDKFKINIGNISNQKISKTYNAKSYLNYECKYNEVENWNDFIWKVHLMLRFYTGNLLFPQTKIILNNFNNFKIIFNGFKSLGKRDSIFAECYNNFSEFLQTSFEIFNENWRFYNLLFTYWTNMYDKRFTEILNLSGFVVFELLAKHLLPQSDGEFPDKLYHVFISQNFDLEFFNELFFKEFTDRLENIHKEYLKNCQNTKLVNETFKFYKTNFILFYIQYYRNKIVHYGELNFEENILPEILNKIHDKQRNIYLKKNELSKKTISDFKSEYENKEGTYWKGFRKGFKIGNELKIEYSSEYYECILPIINDIHNTLNEYFKENIINIMDPLEAFDKLTTIFLINCTLPNEPKFYINGEYIRKSKEYISKFIK